MKISEISTKYKVRKLDKCDIDAVYELSLGNEQFYKYCPPFATKESIAADMQALPPGVSSDGKYYIGFYECEKLIAIMDLVLGYPNKNTAFIGLFMTDKSTQGKGIGTEIITECSNFIKKNGFSNIRLGYAKGNPQPETFWKKNGFAETGIEKDCGEYVAVLMQKTL